MRLIGKPKSYGNFGGRQQLDSTQTVTRGRSVESRVENHDWWLYTSLLGLCQAMTASTLEMNYYLVLLFSLHEKYLRTHRLFD